MTASPPIAIVGIGCRLPGGVDGPEALWMLLEEGRDAIGPIPPNRFDVDSLYDERPGTPGRISNRVGGYLDDIDRFDAGFFAMSHREAELLDPQQRLLLETSWESLEDAGIGADSLEGTSAGVFVGMWTNEYESRMFADTDDIDFYMTTGTGRYAASGRISFFLDLLGPSVTIDTACSSSLVAVHLASDALNAGDCDVALAGGVNLIIEPFITIAYSQPRMMAPDGRCKFGDSAADGYVRSEGVVMVALKRVDDAIAAGDRIYAVVRGSSVTSDGRGSGSLPRPDRGGQEEMLRRAYRRAGVDPRSVQYVEAHGTGTAAGDPVELGSLGAVVGSGRSAGDPCLVGSIKSNIGHTEGAAGAAGLAKLALALHHGKIPASLHVHEPNPAIPWAAARMQLVTELGPWPTTDGPRRGGVSAYGIAGTNAHVVVEEAPPAAPDTPSGRAAPALLLSISASDVAALDELGERYATLLESDPERAGMICAAAATRRSHLLQRRAFSAESAPVLAGQIRQRAGEPGAVVPDVVPSAVFVFPGQGSQWVGMARELLSDEPVFAEAMAACDEAIRDEAGWSPIEILIADDHPRIDDIDVVQPLLFAVEVALAATWRGWGVEPSAVVGHSMGEVAAAHVAGVLDLADAVAVICRRSALLRRLSGRGAMAVVDLSADETDEVIASYADRLSVAVRNSRRSTVISGDPAAVDEVIARLEADDVFCRRVHVDVASHSPQVDPLLAELRASLAGIEPRSADVPFVSTVSAGEIDGSSLTAEYWCDNLRRPVRFADAVEGLLDRGVGAFVEMSPHPVLLPAIEQTVGDVDATARCVASLRRHQPERATLLAGLAALYELGIDPDWGRVFGTRVPHVDLPGYPWQRSRFWHDRPDVARRGSAGDSLLGHRFVAADAPDVVVWERLLDVESESYLGDHVVRGSRLAPATLLVELMCAAARRHWSEPDVEIDVIRLHRMLPLDGDGVRIQVRWEPRGDRQGRVQLRAAPAGGGDWTLHAEGELRRAGSERAALDLSCGSSHGDAGGPAPECDPGEHAAAMRRRGLTYGPSFCRVESCAVSDGTARGTVAVDERVPDAERTVTMLDAALQLLIAALPPESVPPSATFVPVAIEAAVIAGATWSDRADVTATITSIDGDGGAFCGHISIAAEHTALANLGSVRFERVGRETDLDELLFDVVSRPAERQTGDRAAPSSWLIFSDGEWGSSLVAELDRRGVTNSVVEGDPDIDGVTRLVAELMSDGGTLGVVELRANRAGEVDLDGSAVMRSTVVLLQALAASGRDQDIRMWTVTVDAVDDSNAGRDVGTPAPSGSIVRDVAVRRPLASMVRGLGRVAAAEFPAMGCTLVDIGPDDIGPLVDELLAADVEPEVVIRGDDRWIRRLERSTLPDTQAGRHFESDEYRLAAETPGSLDGLGLRHQARRRPGPGEIEIRVEAAGLNFIDVLKAMGIYPGVDSSPDLALGAECAGVIVEVGAGVEGLAVGDAVVAITPSYQDTALMATHATLPADFVVRRPDDLAASVAAALPVAYVTAQLALEEIGRVREGDQVLVHAATGGVGLAAIEICRSNGAAVLATAGSEHKRSMLRSMGITHVFDSRSTDFADGVLDATEGRGVDIVVNSLAGPAIDAGLTTLAKGGRFIEIGKRDVWGGTRMMLGALRDNQTFSVLDLAGLTSDAPDAVARSLRSVMGRIAAGHLAPLPIAAAPIAEAPDVFRTMAAAAHTGKLVLTVDSSPARVAASAVRPGVTYLISGGTGALGLATAERLAARGATHLALMARSTPGDAAQRAIEEIERRGVTIRLLRADVASRDAVIGAIDELRATMPRLAGVFHAAGTLADATISTFDADRWSDAIVPKVAGVVNLHEATAADELELFVLFSSVVGVLGLPGQANYAAANAFLDAFAQERRRSGRVALSVAWGPWAGAGLAAEQEGRGDRLASQGMGSLVPAEALDVLDRLLDAPIVTDPIVMRFDADRWIETNPRSAMLVGGLVADDVPGSRGARGSDESTFLDQVQRVPAGPRRRAAAETAIRDRLAAVLRTPSELIDPQRPLKAMGLDSLMALELRNRLERDTGLTLPATIAWNYPTLVLLADHLAELLGFDLDAEVQPATAAQATSPARAGAASSEVVDHRHGPPTASERLQPAPEDAEPELSEAELTAVLDDELDEIDRLLDQDGPAL